MIPLHVNQKVKSFNFDNVTRNIIYYIKFIINDSNSKKLFLFLCITFLFAFVELLYGMWTNCLGLISDSFHMFFDCTALLIGLTASLITRKKPTNKFSYGYARVEVIAGFINSLMLCFIAFYIFSEAIERLFFPPTVHHDRLMLVSVLGFIVNLVGIYVFHSGHDHGHGHSHSHNHDKHPNIINKIFQPFIGCHHSGESSQKGIIDGVFLHILADTLGSVGVIISSYFIENYGLMIADPISTIIIAVLIIMSVYSLLKQSILVLMQRTPEEIELYLPGCLKRIHDMEGVVAVTEPRFWTLCHKKYVGNLKIEVRQNTNISTLLEQSRAIFSSIGVKHLYIQTDFTVL